jgi:CrcB protein
MPGCGRWSSLPATLPDPKAADGGLPPHARPGLLALVLAGGMAGTLSRYGLEHVIPTPAGLPLGVLLINLGGALALGVLLEALARRGPDAGRRRALRLLLGTGFLGGFTTYSALAVDSARLIGEGHAVEGAAYLLGSVLIGLCATSLGFAVGRRFGRGVSDGVA